MQGEKTLSGDAVVLFCEECGRRNKYNDPAEIERQGGYKCEFCHFFTPLYASSALRVVTKTPQAVKKETPEQPFIGWQPHTLFFGSVSSRAGASKRLIVYPTVEGEELDLEVQPVAELTKVLSVSELESQAYLVTVLPVREAGNAVAQFQGPGLTVRDRRTGREVEIAVSFELTSPKLELDRTQVNMGRIKAGQISEDFVVVKNSGNEILHLHIQPDPNYFSIATQFTIDTPSSVFIEPGESRKIPFSIWPTEDITSNWSYFQPICLETNELSQNNKRNVVITCVIDKN